MKFLVLGLICIFALHAMADDSCTAYLCKAFQGSSNKSCALWESNTTTNWISLKPCTVSGEYCPLPAESGYETTCTNVSTSLLPGDYCTVSTACLSGNCIKNLCKGKLEAVACASDAECDVGLYCDTANTKTCVQTVAVGAACTSDSRCDPVSFCYNNNCTAYAQLPVGAVATSPSACQTYYISEGKCAKGPTLADGNFTCPAEGACTYKVGSTTTKMACSCGKTEKTILYCNLGQGDVSSFSDVSSFEF